MKGSDSRAHHVQEDTMAQKKTTTLTKAELSKLDTYQTVSAKIRYLHAQGYRNGDISRALTAHEGKLVRPQWVSNVLHTEVKNPTEK